MKFIALPRIVMPYVHADELVEGKLWAVISITEPNVEWPLIVETESCKGVLRLAFHDIDEPEEPYVAFNEGHAKQILDFVKQMKDANVDLFIVHCRAGWSRSPAVAAALTKIYGQNDNVFFRNLRPNAYVYRLLLNTNHQEENHDEPESTT
jgi:predicted protein tyrosine phosphatase